MRCKACDSILNDYESTRKDSENNYIDLCGTCYRITGRTLSELNDVTVDAISDADDTINNPLELL